MEHELPNPEMKAANYINTNFYLCTKLLS